MKASNIQHLSFPKTPEERGVMKSLKNTEHLKTFMLYLRPEFQEQIQNIRLKYKINVANFNGFTIKDRDGFALLMGNKKLLNEVKTLRIKFKLSQRWDDFLLQHIITDDVVSSYDIEGLRLETRENKSGEKEYHLHLTNRTTLEDIKSAWPLIEKTMGKKDSREKPWKKFWRDYYIYDLAQEGKVITEIAAEVRKKFGEDLDYGNIKKILSSFVKTIGISKKYIKNKLKTKR